MRKVKKVIAGMMCAALLCISAAGPVQAGEDTKWLQTGVDFSKEQVVYVWQQDPPIANWVDETIFPLKKNIPAKKIRNVKSSNPKVIRIGSGIALEGIAESGVYNEKVGGRKAVVLRMTLKKPGRAAVSFRYGSKTYRIRYVVKKAGNGLKNLKFGGLSKDYASRFNSSSMCEIKDTKKPSSISVRTKKNWVVTSIEVQKKAGDLNEDQKTVFSDNKGKANVTLKGKAFSKGIGWVGIECRNKKTGEEEYYEWWIGK